MMLLGSLAVIGSAGAQDVLPPPDVVVSPPPSEQVARSPAGVLTSDEFVPSSGMEESPFQYGPLTLQPHLLYQFLHVSGILSSPGHTQTTSIHRIAPGLLSAIGSHWTLDYTATWVEYSNPHFRDSLHHDVLLLGTYVYEDWVLRLLQSYVESDTTLIETGQQTTHESYLTVLQASHRIDSKLSLELNGYQDFRYAQGFTTVREWSTLDWLSYQLWPRFSVALGLGIGYSNLDPGFDQTFEQYRGRVGWQLTDKISLWVHGGEEVRQSSAPGAGNQINPVGLALIQYQVTEVTTLSLRARRTETESFFVNQVVEATHFSATLKQRFLEKLYLNLDTGYRTDKYIAQTTKDASGGRKDTGYFVDIWLSSTFLKRGTISTFYRFENNNSNRTGFGFESNQFGIEIAYRY